VDSSRLRSVAMIAVFDIAGPLVAYDLLHSHGFSTVSALVLSGVFPAVKVIAGIIKHRRVDAVGALVLAGIVVGAILALVSHNPKLVLDEGSVGTGVFGLLCLGSLARPEPLMYRLAMEFIGPDSEQGREFTGLWQYKEFRHVFRVITVVWGTVYLAEAAARIVIVANTSTGTAFAVSKVMPYAVTAALIVWNIGYGRLQKRRGEALAAEAAARASEDDLPAADGEQAATRLDGLRGGEAVALVEQAGDDDLERRYRLGAVAAAVVFQDDRARPGVRHDVGDDLADSWRRPVPGVNRPVQGRQVLARAVLERRPRPGAVRRAEQRRRLAYRGVDGIGGAGDLGARL
jgi:hypothetical protein